jgi:hypothetical protein
MNSSAAHNQEHLDMVFLYALQTLSANEAASVEAQISSCAECLQEIQTLRPIVASFACWPTDVVRPTQALWGQLARRIATETGTEPFVPPAESVARPEWEEAAPGILVQRLATDTENNRVSMLVRLAPGTDFPPHRHSDVEELHLLHGELRVDEKRLHPGDYLRAEAGSVDGRVWSETGCTCVLMTSLQDVLL